MDGSYFATALAVILVGIPVFIYHLIRLVMKKATR